MSTLAHAIALAATYFEETFDKGGEPYILHCLHVMNAMPKGEHDLRIVAVLHDIVEDTSITIEDLRHMGYSENILESINYMTHRHSDSYDEYIKRIATNRWARLVKLADLTHNSDIMRMKGLGKKDFDRLEKYHRAYAYLRY